MKIRHFTLASLLVSAVALSAATAQAQQPNVPGTGTDLLPPVPRPPVERRFSPNGRPIIDPGTPPPPRSSPTAASTATIPIGTTYPPSSWSSSPLNWSNGQKCVSKVTQYDVGNFPLFTVELHSDGQYVYADWVVIWDEWIAEDGWYSWTLMSNTDSHYYPYTGTAEAWSNSHFGATSGPFAAYDAWPYLRNRQNFYGQCWSNNSSLNYEQFPGLRWIWYRTVY
jgi:hypothetical protein